MTDQTPKASATAAKAQAPDTSGKDAVEQVRYSLDDLARNGRALLRTSPHVVRGALAGESRKTMTLADAEDAIRAYLKREVPADDGAAA